VWYASKILLLSLSETTKKSLFFLHAEASAPRKSTTSHVAFHDLIITHARNTNNNNQNVFSLCRSIFFHGIVCLSSIVAKIDQEILSLVCDREEHRVDG